MPRMSGFIRWDRETARLEALCFQAAHNKGWWKIVFTKNFYLVLASAFQQSSNSTLSTSFKSFSGGSYKVAYGDNAIGFAYDSNAKSVPSMYYVRTSFTGSPAGNGGVLFGTGNAQPTLNDYKLSGDHITTIVATTSVTVEHKETQSVYTGLYTITNTGSEPITISEVALFCNPTTNSNSGGVACLLERTVLETPVQIDAGGIGQVTYEIRYDYPT